MADEAKPASESAEDKDAGKGEQKVPYERFAHVVAQLKVQGEELRALKDQLGQKPRSEPEAWSRATLQAAVEAKKVTPAEAAEIWDQQLVLEATRKATEAVKQESHLAVRRSAVLAYEKAIPELGDDDSEAFKKVQKVYRKFVREHGLPEGDAAMLAACEATFGPAESLRPLTRKEPEPFAETGGGGAVEVAKGLKLTPVQKAGYEKLMNAGAYPGGWDEVRKEREAYPSRAGKRLG